MMLYPKISDLMKGLESRYSLCVITAKRARQIASETSEDKAVSKAVQEIASGKVQYYNPHDNDSKNIQPEATNEANE